MKEKLKKLRLLFCFTLAGLLFYSCNMQEETIKSEEHQQNLKISKKSFDELIKDPQFKNALSKIKKDKKNLNTNLGRTVMEDQYGFTIADHLVNVIESDTVISYTMLIHRTNQTSENETSNDYENLIVQVNNQNRTRAIIIKYSPANDTNTTQAFQGTKTITPIVFNSNTSSTTSRYFQVICVTTTINYGPCPQYPSTHTPGVPPCLHPASTSSMECTTVYASDGTDTGTGTGDGTGTGTGGGGTTTGGSTTVTTPPNNCGACDPILTAPAEDDEPTPVAPNDHVAELLKLTKNKADGSKTNIKIKIDILRSDLATATFEGGAMYNANQTPLAPTIVAPTETNWAAVPREYYIKLHRHQDNYTPIGTNLIKPTNPVESDMDVYNILKLHNYTANKNTTDFFVSRLGTFAIRVTDRSKANAAFNSITNSQAVWEAFSMEYDEAVTDLYLAPPPMNETQIMINFISFINTTLVNGQTMGLSIYQAIYDSQGNIINWGVFQP